MLFLEIGYIYGIRRQVYYIKGSELPVIPFAWIGSAADECCRCRDEFRQYV